MHIKHILTTGLLSASGAVLAVCVPPSSPSPALADGAELRIMPLGDSITWGTGSSGGAGYRLHLHDALIREGNWVNLVGSRRGGDFPNNNNEGWPSLTVEQIHEKAVLPGSVRDLKPNIVLLHAGTNDALQFGVDVGKAGERLEALINDVQKLSPRAVVIVASLILCLQDKEEARIEAINEQYRALVRKLEGGGPAARKVLLVEMHSSAGSPAPQPADMVDDRHPNDSGYNKMADIWVRGLKEADQRGWIVVPEAI